MPKLSAGLLLYRPAPGRSAPEVLLVHMGGPYWARKDARAWSIPKGEYTPEEDTRSVAYREFAEELGQPPPPGEPILVGTVRQPSGKLITVYALPGDLDATTAVSNEFTLEWPPGSGRLQAFPEVDRAEWFDLTTAREKLVAGQVPFLDLLLDAVGGASDDRATE